jgi:hypothetical protein
MAVGAHGPDGTVDPRAVLASLLGTERRRQTTATLCAPIGGLPAHLRCATGASMPHNDSFGGLLGTPHSVDSATLHSVDLYSDDRSRLAGHLSTHMPRPAASNPNHGPVAGRRGWGCAELGGADGRLRGSAFRVCASQDPKTGLSQHCACH